MDTFTTARLAATRPRLEDFEDYYALCRDTRVMATLSADGKALSREETERKLRGWLDHWEQHGYGPWTCRARATGQFVGYCGFKEAALDGKSEAELFFAVKSEDWGQGFATEMVNATLAVGFGRLGMKEVVAYTLQTNRASQRVLGKAGFKYERATTRAGLGHALYRLAKAGWRLA